MPKLQEKDIQAAIVQIYSIFSKFKCNEYNTEIKYIEKNHKI
jgi:hypothetical protein